MKKLDISQRGRVQAKYGNLALYSLIDEEYGYLALPRNELGVSTEDVLQAVMAWIDKVRCEPSEDKVCQMLSKAWEKQWRYFLDMAEEERKHVTDGELTELVSAVLQLVCDCLASLAREWVDGDLHYRRCFLTLLGVLHQHGYGEFQALQKRWYTQAYRELYKQMDDWIVRYVDGNQPLCTAADGTLVLDDKGVVLTPPADLKDQRLFSDKAQRIWKRLIADGYCEKSGAGLLWKCSSLSLGYLVRLVADELRVKNVVNEKIEWKLFEVVFLDLQDKSTLRKARNGAARIKKGTHSYTWPEEAQALRDCLKLAK